MGVIDIVSPILGAGRTMVMNNFQKINPVSIYETLQNMPNIREQFQIPTVITDTALAKKIKGIFAKDPPLAPTATKRTVEGVDEDVPAEEQTTEEQAPSDGSMTTGQIVFLTLSYTLALGMISFVINDMIMHPFISRLIMTIVILIIVTLNPITPYIIFIYYLINAMWKYYSNSQIVPNKYGVREGAKRLIPYIYGLFPFTTMAPRSMFASIFLAPFRYKPDVDIGNMKWDRREWMGSLLESFSNKEATLKIGEMGELCKQYEASLGNIHEFTKMIEVKDGDKTNVSFEKQNPFAGEPSTCCATPSECSAAPAAKPTEAPAPAPIPTAPTAPKLTIQPTAPPAAPIPSAPPAAPIPSAPPAQNPYEIGVPLDKRSNALGLPPPP